jgi:hypothetical protein
VERERLVILKQHHPGYWVYKKMTMFWVWIVERWVRLMWWWCGAVSKKINSGGGGRKREKQCDKT